MMRKDQEQEIHKQGLCGGRNAKAYFLDESMCNGSARWGSVYWHEFWNDAGNLHEARPTSHRRMKTGSRRCWLVMGWLLGRQKRTCRIVHPDQEFSGWRVEPGPLDEGTTSTKVRMMRYGNVPQGFLLLPRPSKYGRAILVRVFYAHDMWLRQDCGHITEKWQYRMMMW